VLAGSAAVCSRCRHCRHRPSAQVRRCVCMADCEQMYASQNLLQQWTGYGVPLPPPPLPRHRRGYQGAGRAPPLDLAAPLHVTSA